MKIKRHCDKHGDYEAEQMEIFGSVIYTNCPTCERLESEREELEEKTRQAERNRADLLARGIEPEYFGKKLTDYRAETPSEQNALEKIKDLKAGKIKKVLLLGSNGVGKTMLACILAQDLNGIVTTMFEVSARIRAAYNDGSGRSEFDILNGFLRYDFIAIDELGRTKGSDAELNWLSYLIDKAHVRGIRLLLISNKKLARNLPENRRGDGIETFLGNDTISRLRQSTAIVEINGRDRRGTITTI